MDHGITTVIQFESVAIQTKSHLYLKLIDELSKQMDHFGIYYNLYRIEPWSWGSLHLDRNFWVGVELEGYFFWFCFFQVGMRFQRAWLGPAHRAKPRHA